MRYRIACGGEGLPPLEAQRARVADSAYDIQLDGQIVTQAGGRTLLQRTGRVQARDEIAVWDLDILQLSMVELLPVLLLFLDLGVAITPTRVQSGDVAGRLAARREHALSGFAGGSQRSHGPTDVRGGGLTRDTSGHLGTVRALKA